MRGGARVEARLGLGVDVNILATGIFEKDLVALCFYFGVARTIHGYSRNLSNT